MGLLSARCDNHGVEHGDGDCLHYEIISGSGGLLRGLALTHDSTTAFICRMGTVSQSQLMPTFLWLQGEREGQVPVASVVSPLQAPIHTATLRRLWSPKERAAGLLDHLPEEVFITFLWWISISRALSLLRSQSLETLKHLGSGQALLPTVLPAGLLPSYPQDPLPLPPSVSWAPLFGPWAVLTSSVPTHGLAPPSPFWPGPLPTQAIMSSTPSCWPHSPPKLSVTAQATLLSQLIGLFVPSGPIARTSLTHWLDSMTCSSPWL